MAFRLSKKHNISAALFLLVILPLSVYLAMQQTNYIQRASLGVPDLNTAAAITTTNNPDGTMGPSTWAQNFAQTLSANKKRNLAFHIGTHAPLPPGATLTPAAQRKPSITNTAISEFSSLRLTFSKVEVHLTKMGEVSVTSAPSPTEQLITHWETLALNGIPTVDLLDLAATEQQALLGKTSLAVGKYNEIRLYISEATAVRKDGTEVFITIPEKHNVIRIVHPFVVTLQGESSISVDFNVAHSITKVGDAYILKPVVSRLSTLKE